VRWLTLAVIAVLLVACSSASEGEHVQQLATATSAATPTSSSTPTPRPSPTSLPTPLVTPPPTPNQMAAAAALYYFQRAVIAEATDAAMARIGEMSGAPQLLSPPWRREYRQQFNTLRESALKIEALTPPACVAAVHQASLRATDAQKRAATLINQSLDAIENGRIGDSVQPIQQASEVFLESARLTQAAKKLMEEVKC
jgi:hypothetical protein